MTTLSKFAIDPASTASRLSTGTVGERVAAAVALFGIGDDGPALRQAVIDHATAALRTAPPRGEDGAPLFDSDEKAMRLTLLRELRDRFRIDTTRRWCGSYCLSLAHTFLPGFDLSDVEIESHDLLSGAWIEGDLILNRSRIDARPPLLRSRSARTSTSYAAESRTPESRQRSSLLMTGLTVGGDLLAEDLTVKGMFTVSGSMARVRVPRLLALGGVRVVGLRTQSLDLAGAHITLALDVTDSTVSHVDLTGAAARGGANFVRLDSRESTVTVDVTDASLPTLQFRQCPQLSLVGTRANHQSDHPTTRARGR